MLQRRQFLIFAAAAGIGALSVRSRMAFARASSDTRFVFVIQRGAADGLNIVVPTADRDYDRLRGTLAISDALKLDAHFGLHPALAETARMYAAGQALFVHAVASSYRERSHFDGQNVLETGALEPFQLENGWMNRLVAALPNAETAAIAFAPTVPLALRGAAQVGSYAPSAPRSASHDLLAQVGELYARDEQLHAVWEAAMEARQIAGESRVGKDPAALGRLASNFLVREDGPRIAMIESGGWDTHAQQADRLANRLRALDTMLASFRDGLGPVWAKTVVLVATEFGRTAVPNGTGGTDHGTASAAMLIGGAVRGGRVIADWPGLAPGNLHEGRDLKPTASLEALIAGVTAESFGVDPNQLFNLRKELVPFEQLLF